jgi:hypothetical protein
VKSANRLALVGVLAGAACAFTSYGGANAATITVVKQENSDIALVTVEGAFILEDIQDFRQKVMSQPKALVAFESNGGSVIAGIEIGKIIRLRNFATLVPDNVQCASACALAWLGGSVRFMGPQARIGFHAAYVVEGGKASETGSGNALVGAYLANMGLPDSAIIYATQAAPTAMTWLNLTEAQQKGIEVALFTEQPNNASPPQTKSQPILTAPTPDLDSKRQTATNFVISLLAHWSGSDSSRALRLFDAIYSPQVSYYGATRTKQEVLQDKFKFSERWPQRLYRVREGSLIARCGVATSECNVSGIMEWVVESPNRRVKSSGAASFSYGLTVEGQSVLIFLESSNVLERRTEYIPSLESEESLRRSVWKFHEVYQSSGIVGLNAEIKSCWERLRFIPAEAEIAYCFGLDYVSGSIDDAVVKERGWPPNQYTTFQNRAQRVDAALTR